MGHRHTAGTSRRGAALLFSLFMAAALLTLGLTLTRLAFHAFCGTLCEEDSLRALYLAEGALEKGKTELEKDPDWHTDPLHSPSDDPDWVMESALGSSTELNGGTLKVVKEAGKAALYGAGYYKKGRKLVKYDMLDGYWKEL